MITVNQSFSPRKSFKKGKFTRQLNKKVGKGEEVFVYLNGLLQTRGSNNDYTLKGRALRLLWAVSRRDRIDVLFFN